MRIGVADTPAVLSGGRGASDSAWLAGSWPTCVRGGRETFLAREAARLERLSAAAGSVEPSLEACQRRYLEVRRLKRRIALANPLLGFDKLLLCKRVPPPIATW